MWVAFALQKLLTFSQRKISAYILSLDVNFNESLTNDIALNNWALIGLGGRSGWSGCSLYCQRSILSSAESCVPVCYWMLYTDRPRGFGSALCRYSGRSWRSLSLYVHVSANYCWVVCYTWADGGGPDRPELKLGLIWACIVPVSLKGIL